ncbi:PilT/PilU family type 4a pilus ATPase [bacterium]|nr:PilT/PilU family type 4a pilus ATPase [candidate division CSSED10-310 bacterium]
MDYNPEQQNGNATEIVDLATLLKIMVQKKASDLFIGADSCPCIRSAGQLLYLNNLPVLDTPSAKKIVFSALKETQKKEFETNLELDLSFRFQDLGRFRMNVYSQRGRVSAAIRLLPSRILSLEELGFPEQIKRFANLTSGLVLITGATGSGKSTTLASFIELINVRHFKHIITIEDPIEFNFTNKNCLIDQREITTDTRSFHNALRYVLRQNPDVIVLGEIRDMESMASALSIAETGHLVFGTLHTNSAAKTINRVSDFFPSQMQDQVRSQLSLVLEGVVCQKLLPMKDRKGRIVASEIMFTNSGIAHKIRTNRVEQIHSDIQTSMGMGSQTMAYSLASLCQEGHISEDIAEPFCETAQMEELRSILRRGKDPDSIDETTPSPVQGAMPGLVSNQPDSSKKRIGGKDALISRKKQPG